MVIISGLNKRELHNLKVWFAEQGSDQDESIQNKVDCVIDAITDLVKELEAVTIESCPHCENEVEIKANNPSKCPECGVEIIPCSTCWKEKEGSRACDWTPEKRCWRFPA